MTASIASVATRLESALGAAAVSAQPTERAKYSVDGMTPAAVVRPGSVEEIVELVRLGAAEKLAIIPCGARTKLAMGMPPGRYDVALDMRRMNGVAHYDPGDLTLSVDAGTTLSAIDALLAEKNQFLPLAVPFFENATIGGTVASGVDSPLRHGYGTVRDFLIGAEFVNGAGALTKSGGRVVKNVTGYDLHKLLIGSLGTLAVITRLNFRTFPRPLVRRGFLAAFDDEHGALVFRRKIASSPLTPSLLEVLSPEATRTLYGVGSRISSLLVGSGAWQVCVGFEGTPEVCERYAREVSRMAQESSAHDALLLREAQFPALLEQLREAIPLLLRSSPLPVLFRFSGLPSETPSLVRGLRSFVASSWIPSAILLRSLGVLYLALLPTGHEESLLKQVAYFWKSVDSLRGKLDFQAEIEFCPSEWKRELNVWGAERSDQVMMRRVKFAFDPQNVFSPGRFVGGI
jgi:glycolate oxidase FAD binding subunit